MIYFVQSVDGGPIKIGVTFGVAKRLSQLHREHKTKLRVLAVMPGDHARERKLHRRFGHLRLEREWFEALPELLEFIEESGQPWTGCPSQPWRLSDDEPSSPLSPFDEQPIEIDRWKLYAFRDYDGEWHCLDGADLVELATRTWRAPCPT